MLETAVATICKMAASTPSCLSHVIIAKKRRLPYIKMRILNFVKNVIKISILPVSGLSATIKPLQTPA